MNPTAPDTDHGQLLDVIDSLRSHGKSSVLEAVSGVRFPTKDTLCTRFATELILRRAPVANLVINIRPSEGRSSEEKKRLTDFKAPTESIEKIADMIDAAKEVMGLSSEVKTFSEDILQIEVSGPEQPHLTLVDLPGLFHASSKQQSTEDSELVKSLVRSYMASERSIILAIVSAKNDINNQVVTAFARQVDPRGLRTLGIITKPDTLLIGSDSERAFRDLAKNDDVSFRLGWHVLRNRDFDTKDQCTEERDKEEMKFFSHGIWTSPPPHILGIATLKPRLSTVLRRQIISVLPSLTQDVQAGIKDCQNKFLRLGEQRQTALEQRQYLVGIGHSFTSLVSAAMNGVYTPEFFDNAMTKEGYSKRLRAVVQNLLLDLAEEMRRKGKSQVVIEDGQDVKLEELQISESAFISDVIELMKRSRGCELPGTFNPLIVGDLFYKQSKPWGDIVEVL